MHVLNAKREFILETLMCLLLIVAIHMAITAKLKLWAAQCE